MRCHSWVVRATIETSGHFTPVSCRAPLTPNSIQDHCKPLPTEKCCCCGLDWICGDEDGGCVGGRGIDGKSGWWRKKMKK
jgi:hypothetical protein